jgi:hypothetical protein
VNGDFLTRGGKPFFPVGTNYFTTEENGWDFSGPRNASVWEKDFAEMAAHGVTFVRTGVWMKNAKFIEPGTGEAGRALPAQSRGLSHLCPSPRHSVNFTFFAFSRFRRALRRRLRRRIHISMKRRCTRSRPTCAPW